MLTITRQTYTDRSVSGMMDLDGVFQCYTLEPPKGTVKPHCIPSGIFKGKKYHSPSLGRIVLLLIGVPGFEDIEIHNGNYPRNTHGCTLVGQTRGTDFVGNSIAALDALIPKLPDDFEVSYIDTEPQKENHENG